jgi:hypothetical protein
MSQWNAGMGAMILLDSIELEALVLPRLLMGSCYRALAAECHNVSLHLVQAIVDPGTLTLDGDAVYDKAESMANAFDRDERDTPTIPEAVDLFAF